MRFVAKNHAARAERMVSVLLSANALDLIKREEKDFLSIVLGGITEEELLEHSLRYPYLLWNCYDETIALDFLRNRAADLEKFKKDELRLRIKEIELQAAQIDEEQKLLLKMIPENLAKKAKLIRDLGTDRLEVKNAWTGVVHENYCTFSA